MAGYLIGFFLFLCGSFAVAGDFTAECSKLYQQKTQLSQKQIHELCEARDLDLMHFNVLHKSQGEKCERTVVMLGENHFADEAAFEKGKHIVSLFRIRGGEGAPNDDLKKLKSATAVLAELAKEKPPTSEPAPKGGSAQRFGKNQGFFVGAEYSKFNGVLLDKAFADSGPVHQWLSFLDSLQLFETGSCSEYRFESHKEILSDPKRFVSIFGDMMGKPGFPPVTIWLENGPVDNYDISCEKYDDECYRYLATERNKRMAKNIAEDVSMLPCDIPFLVMIGNNHIGPLTRLLQQRGYKSYEKELSQLPYKKAGTDPAFPDD